MQSLRKHGPWVLLLALACGDSEADDGDGDSDVVGNGNTDLRPGGDPCTTDDQCFSNSCNPTIGACRSSTSEVCTETVGCAQPGQFCFQSSAGDGSLRCSPPDGLPNSPCGDDGDCAFGSVCVTEIGRCASDADSGESCGFDEQCLVAGDTCRPRPFPAGTSDRVCRLGLVDDPCTDDAPCRGGLSCSAGTCVLDPGACLPAPGRNDCGPDDNCQLPSGSATFFQCVPRSFPGVGQGCSGGCNSDLLCADPFDIGQDVCYAPCTRDSDCPPPEGACLALAPDFGIGVCRL